MSVIAIPVSTILCVIPTGIPMVAKLIWATLAYMLWDYGLYALRCADFWHCHYNDA